MQVRPKPQLWKLKKRSEKLPNLWRNES